MILSNYLRTMRQRTGLSQAEVARRTGITRNALNRIELGRTRDPRISLVVAIIRALGIDSVWVRDLVDLPTSQDRKHGARARILP